MIGEKIKERRTALNLTQEELAQKLGYKSKSAINKIELGINDIAQSKIKAFAKALNCTVAYLMEWDNESAELFKIENLLILQSENPKYQPKKYINEQLDHIRIVGKAIAFQSDIV